MLECVVNISEGRDEEWLAATCRALGSLADLHSDPSHHRSVLTLIGEPEPLLEDVMCLARLVLAHLDLRRHQGVHPKVGLLDVVPFVPLGSASLVDAVRLRDRAATRLAVELELPVFLYGPLPDGGERSLPELRRRAFVDLRPELGPEAPDPSVGAVAAGARMPLVAWNLWLRDVDLAEARQVATGLRSPTLRSLGLTVEGASQVSCNLIDPTSTTPADVYDEVAAALGGTERIARAELVGLVPAAVLRAVPATRWAELDLREERTIESACARLGLQIS